ncbi:hypothetical protein Tco_1028031, partial [Tanacetum coccineum]
DLDLFKLAIVLQKAKQIQDFGPASGIRASRGDDEASYHEDASENGTEEYDIWAMEIEHYLEYIDNDVWKVIQNENSKKRISTGNDGVVRILPPVSAAEIHAFEAFTISSSEGLEKGYDRFQQLLSQLEAHGAEVSTEDANHKFLRSLPLAWSNLAMTMRTKPDVDTLSIDDLYNNLRVFEQELTSTTKSSASAQNVAFVSHSKSSNNKVKTGHTGPYSTYTPSTSSNNIPEREVLAGFADEVIYSLFAKQSEDLDLLHEDLEQIDDECPSKGTNDGKKRDSFYQDQGARKKEQNQNCLLTMDDGVVNWGEHTVEEEETNHALMAISSNTEVSLCSKTCIDSYNKLKTLCDEQMNQLGEQEAKILAYTLAVKKLEAQIVTFQKQQLSLNEQLTFQANEIYAKDEKLKRYRRIGMKAVKEKEQLQKTVDSWKNSSKNLWKLVDSGMTSNSKVGLGYEIQSNKEVLSYEEEMNRTVFQCTEKDFLNKPLYSRFSKTDNFKGVPHPLTGDYTPKPQEEIDDSLYVYGKKGPQKPEISDSDDNSTEHSTCQSNDSEGSFGNPSKHSSESESESISVPNEMSASKSVITNEKVMSESKEVEPSCATHVKTPRQQMKNQGTSEVKGKNWNKMMERELGELQLNAVRQNVNSVRPNVNTGRVNVNSVRHHVNSVRTNVNTGISKQPVPTCNSNSFSHVRPQGNWGTTVKTSACYNWRRPRPNSNHNSRSNFVRTDHPLKNMEDRGIFDSGCSGHMTGNKDHQDDFEECKGGSITFGGSKGYITGKGRIKHKVLFTKTGCLVVSPDFKMPDENQILLKVPRQNNMYSFDMKTPGVTKDYACLIAKATSDESKLWHMRLEMTKNPCTEEECQNDALRKSRMEMRRTTLGGGALALTQQMVLQFTKPNQH